MEPDSQNASSKPAAMTNEEFEALRVMIEADSAITLREEKRYLLESRMRPLLAEFGAQNYAALHRMGNDSSQPLVRQKIIDAITTNETFWFRDKTPFAILEEVFLPVAVKLILGGRPKVRIWSAACSTGQETYSIAMTIFTFLKKLGTPAVTPANFEILATDLSSEALSFAQLGAYDQFNMQRGMDPTNLNTYFKQNRNFWIVDPALKKIIQFKKFNLQESFGPMGRFDMVFCRNVAIYFSQEFRVDLFRKIHEVLYPDGVFIIGSTESMSFMKHGFTLKEFNRGTFYVATRE